MTIQRMLELLEIEHECMLRGSHDDCDRNCANCELVQDDGDLHEMYTDVIALLKEQNWVKCSDRMPEEHDSIFAKLKGTDKWRSAMFEKSSDDVRIVEVFEDGTRRVYHSHTIDGKWDIENKLRKRTVTHWMPNPELPLEGR